MAIVLDAMGSDTRPLPEVEGAVTAANLLNTEIILVGPEQDLKEKLADITGDKTGVRIVDAPESLDMSDHIQEARGKKLNSMRIGMELVKKGTADAFVTAGNTGLAMYFAMRTFDNLPGVLRPGLCTVFPVKDGRAVVLDIGANAECRPDFLVQFATMGSIYAQTILGIENPRVGLLANGEEEGKGNNLVRETYPLLQATDLNFVGNVEGKELFGGKVDVLVTDGFTGNVLLKSTEGVADLVMSILKEELMRTPRTRAGAFLAKPAFRKIKKMLDPAEIGAAPLLGIDSLVLIGHGRSDARAIVSALSAAKQAIDSQLLPRIRSAITTSMTEG